jgi:hypothetical protein
MAAQALYVSEKLTIFGAKTVVKSALVKAPAHVGRKWGIGHVARLTRGLSQSQEGFMDSRAPEVVSPAVSTTTSAKSHRHEGRNFWVLTAYGISGLALFGVLAYYFSDFVSH